MNAAVSTLLSRARIAGAGAALIAGATPNRVQAQDNSADRPRPVEQGVADVDPLRTSLVVPLDRDLRTPSGWESVYPVRYRDASGQVREGFARASGGVVAIFPWSVYIPTRHGTIISVPPGTVFHLGPLPEVEAEPSRAPEPKPGVRPDTRPETGATVATPASGPALDARAALNAPYRSPPEASEVPSLWTDEGYRVRRMSRLLSRAAAGDHALWER